MSTYLHPADPARDYEADLIHIMAATDQHDAGLPHDESACMTCDRINGRA